MGEPVEHHVVARVLAEIEGLDGDPLHLDPVRLALVGNGSEPVDDPLEASRPAEVGPQRQPDDPGRISHGRKGTAVDGTGEPPSYSYVSQSGPG